MAEREGFEPSTQAHHPCNCLAGSPVQPLQHLSIQGGVIQAELQSYRTTKGKDRSKKRGGVTKFLSP